MLNTLRLFYFKNHLTSQKLYKSALSIGYHESHNKFLILLFAFKILPIAWSYSMKGEYIKTNNPHSPGNIGEQGPISHLSKLK